MFIIVCYDIPNNRRRNKIAHTLEGFGYRVQESVFECDITEAQYTKMKAIIRQKILAAEDSVRYYQLCSTCLQKITIQGLGEVKTNKQWYII